MSQPQLIAVGLLLFSPSDYSLSSYQFPYGQHTVYVTAQNGNGMSSSASNTQNIAIDNVNPTAPTNASAWTDTSKSVSLASNAWNGHNSSPSIYFEWSGAADPIPYGQVYASGVSNYYIYFGSNSNATPSVSGTETINATADISENLSNPVSGTNYYLIIQTVDAAGNLSTPATLFVYKFDNTQPTSVAYVMPNPSGWSDADPFSFSWPTAYDTISGILGYQYERANGTDNWTFTTNLSVSV